MGQLFVIMNCDTHMLVILFNSTVYSVSRRKGNLIQSYEIYFMDTFLQNEELAVYVYENVDSQRLKSLEI